MSDQETCHFWFSAKQKACHDEMIAISRLVVATPATMFHAFVSGQARIGGEIIEYTASTALDRGKDHGCGWDVMVYLGEGVIA